MQTFSEIDLLDRYTPMILSRASRLYQKYGYWTSAYGLEDFIQEAKLGFIRSLRMIKDKTYPLSPLSIGVAETCIFENIYRNLVICGDGIHRRASMRASDVRRTTCVASDLEDGCKWTDSASQEFKNAEFRADISRMPEDRQKVVGALLDGKSQRSIVRERGISRRKVARCINDLKQSYFDGGDHI